MKHKYMLDNRGAYLRNAWNARKKNRSVRRGVADILGRQSRKLRPEIREEYNSESESWKHCQLAPSE